ncbi:DUF2202 domain-containing protein [Dictyoglomus thermophilum]|uniref:DUF2202 domain-containing protein n=1 Tax=Dictyoglomus thermophilum TaxID=14 RepID=UPI0011EAEC47|nr:DUF2202 domain-containing protein [Dictyoglomus thermophilum]TYT21043.1 DUF2202 domain-containing protein [Dictyoglomus thermophilum]
MKRFVLMLGILLMSFTLFSNLGISAVNLSSQEIKDILHMREEEKLARDVYTTLYNLYKIPTFYNISKSEQTHMNAVKTLINYYNLKDPITDDSVGKFSDPKFTELYNNLIERGKKSVIEALKVGILIEELDIKDLQEAINRINKADIIRVYTNLLKGSQNHREAFIKVLQRYGESYTPTYTN